MKPGKLYEVKFNPKEYLTSDYLSFSIMVDNRYINYPSGSHFLCLNYEVDNDWITANVLMEDGNKGELLYMKDTHLDRAIKPLKK